MMFTNLHSLACRKAAMVRLKVLNKAILRQCVPRSTRACQYLMPQGHCSGTCSQPPAERVGGAPTRTLRTGNQVHQAEGTCQSRRLKPSLGVSAEVVLFMASSVSKHAEHAWAHQHFTVVEPRCSLGLPRDVGVESLCKGRVPTQELHASALDDE